MSENNFLISLFSVITKLFFKVPKTLKNRIQKSNIVVIFVCIAFTTQEVVSLLYRCLYSIHNYSKEPKLFLKLI